MKNFNFLFLTFLICVTKVATEEHRYDNLIHQYCQIYGLEPCLVKAVIKVESNFNKYAISQKGATGLMQLMPSTAKILSVQNILSADENIRAGTQYLRDMLYLFNGDVIKALAAYNAGPGAVRRYGGIPPYKETQNYIEKVLNYKSKYSRKNKVYYYTDRDGTVVFFNR